MSRTRRVIIRTCETYDPIRMESIIRDGMAELQATPRGRIFIKPNVVTANRNYIHHSYTHPVLVETMVRVLRNVSPEQPITIGESGGIGLPTRLFFHESGYAAMAKRTNVRLVDLNEEQTVKTPLVKAKWHKTMEVAKSLHEAEYKIWMPKLKFHIVTQITHCVKLNIGILTHKERFLYHDDRLNDKVVDMLEVGYPNLVVTDAITCGRGFESSPIPFQLGAILMANDPIAADMVAARILGYEPHEVLHLAEAERRGYGSLRFDEIEVSGDIAIEALRERTKDLDSPFQDLQKLDSPIRFYEGVNPATGQNCYGGCICSVKGTLGSADRRYAGNLVNARRGAIVMGAYDGDVMHPGEPVVLVGDCTRVSGKLEAAKVIRFAGCPPKVATLMTMMPRHFGMRSPAWEPVNLIKVVFFSLLKAFMRVTIPLRRRARVSYPSARTPSARWQEAEAGDQVRRSTDH